MISLPFNHGCMQLYCMEKVVLLILVGTSWLFGRISKLSNLIAHLYMMLTPSTTVHVNITLDQVVLPLQFFKLQCVDFGQEPVLSYPPPWSEISWRTHTYADNVKRKFVFSYLLLDSNSSRIIKYVYCHAWNEMN